MLLWNLAGLRVMRARRKGEVMQSSPAIMRQPGSGLAVCLAKVTVLGSLAMSIG